MSESHVRVVREFTRLSKNEHNVDGIDHLFHPEFRNNFGPPVRPGLAGFKDVGRMMNTAFPDVVVREEDLVLGGDTVVERSAARATHRASLMGERPTNQPVTWTGIHIYRMKDGMIMEHWVEPDRLGLFKQVGVVTDMVSRS